MKLIQVHNYFQKVKRYGEGLREISHSILQNGTEAQLLELKMLYSEYEEMQRSVNNMRNSLRHQRTFYKVPA